MAKKEANYWPHFIIALVVFAIALGVWTVKTAIDNPVELDNSYMMKYQDVDKNIYEIEKEKKEFDKRYKVVLKNKKLKLGKNEIVLIIYDKESEKKITNAKVEILLTRPDTSKFDKKAEAKYQDGVYVVSFDIDKEGRWNIVVKITVDGISRYFTYKLSTRRIIEQKV